MDQPITLTLALTAQEADLLRTNSMRNFIDEQDGRFVPLSDRMLSPYDPTFAAGTLHWCASAADALLLRCYEEACGHDVTLLSDEASDPAHGPDPWVVLTSRPWAEVWGR